MSYSFTVRAATGALLVAAAAAKFEEVIASQPVHSNDREQALAAVTAMAGVCSEPSEGYELSASVSGSLSWRCGDGLITAFDFSGASVSVHIATVSQAT